MWTACKAEEPGEQGQGLDETVSGSINHGTAPHTTHERALHMPCHIPRRYGACVNCSTIVQLAVHFADFSWQHTPDFYSDLVKLICAGQQSACYTLRGMPQVQLSPEIFKPAFLPGVQ